jgi:PPOX class probable F420-dependent enzyme
MSRRMSPEEWRAFVSTGTRTGKVAIVRRNGAPHVVPIWFVLDGDDFVFTTAIDTVKGKSLRRDGRIALCVDDERPPYAFVSVEGVATTSEDLAEVLHWATKIGARYMGDDRADEFGRRNAVAGEMLVRLTPQQVRALDDVSG